MEDARSHGKRPQVPNDSRLLIPRLSGTTLNCGVHLCPQKCHQLFDHSKMQCEYVLHDQCLKGHKKSWKCHNPPPKVCAICEEDAKRVQDEKQRALETQEKRDREAKGHIAYMAKLDAMLDVERERIKDAQTSNARRAAIRQKEQDIEKTRAVADEKIHSSPQPQPPSADTVAAYPNVKPTQATSSQPNNEQPVQAPELAEPKTREGWARRESPAKEEWERQKKTENASNDAIDSVMEMVGLNEVKLQILKIKAKIDISVRQNSDIKEDRLNVAFLGNPGTGMSGPKPQYKSIF